MHSMGIHSALAIKRQRRRKEEAKKSRERRYSIQSSESGDTLHSPRSSTRRKYRQQHAKHHQPTFSDTKVVTSIGMLHIGVVFLVFGVFLVGAGLIPDDATAVSAWSIFEKDSWWNELVCTGLFAMGLGIFLIVLNGVISKREEEDLESYVARQLTRSRSGHRLERDVETGGLQTRHYRKAKENERGGSSANRSSENLSQNNYVITPTTSEMVTPSTPGELGASGDMLLEKILEEEIVYNDERHHCHLQSPMTSDNDKRLLLPPNGHTVHVTHI